jgi:hypothetical protein
MHANEGEKIRKSETQFKATTRDQMNKFGTINVMNVQNEVQASVVHENSAGTAPEVRPRTEGESLPDHIKQGNIKRLEPS